MNIHETEITSQVTRALCATKQAIHTLETHYKQAAQLKSIKDLSFPYRTHCQAFDGRRIEFRYFERKYPDKLIFLAKTTDEQILFVKFTRKYSADAHIHCAKKGVAPPLHAVETLPGAWLMVVMDLLDGALYHHLEDSHADRDQLRSRVTQAMEVLHQGGYVHGDLRDVNLMIRKEGEVSSENPGVMLLDFDWAGKLETALYPPNVNPEVKGRPLGAEDGLPILRAHDKAMLDYMFR